MSEIATFENAAFDQQVRVMVHNGEPWEEWRRYETSGQHYCTTVVSRLGITNILGLLARRRQQRGFAGITISNQFNF